MTFLFQPETRRWLDNLRAAAASSGPWEAVSVSLAGSIDVPGSPYASSAWRREQGGLWDWGPHALALVRTLLPPVERVFASRGKRDIVTVAMEHRGGASSLMTLTVTAPPNAQHTIASVWGPGGRHELALPTGNLRDAYRHAFRDLRDCIARGVPHPLDVSYGRDTVTILDAARRNLSRDPMHRMDVPRSVTGHTDR